MRSKLALPRAGVAAILKNGEGSIVMYRADMDANAVKEDTGLPYASTVVAARSDGTKSPVAHMCGHDAHTTWMLGLAKFMAENQDTLEWYFNPDRATCRRADHGCSGCSRCWSVYYLCSTRT